MKIKYSILSRGTEKYVGHGYMAISEPKDGKQYIFDLDHNILDTNSMKNKLSFPSKFSINNIVFSRFELISELLFRRVIIQDNILICGLGSVGIACLINLLEHGYKNISIYSKNSVHNLELIEKMYEVKLLQVNKIDDSYKSYVELTGDSLVLKTIIESVSFLKDIVILSTLRDQDYFIDPLTINRKNLIIYGGHEFVGYSEEFRNKVFNDLLRSNIKIENLIKYFISYHNFSSKKLEELLNKKQNYIDVFKY